MNLWAAIQASKLSTACSRVTLAGVALAGASTLLTSTAYGESRQHDAHVHGHAILNVAQEGKEVEVSFEIPAMDLVGFEHQPESHAQKEKVEQMRDLLKKGKNAVAFNQSAGCSVESAKVESALLAGLDHHKEHGHDDHKDHHDAHDHDKHKEHHDDHGHEKHDHHDHEEHAHDDHHDHDKHDEHDHEAHGHSETHSEFELTYHFVCANPTVLSELKVTLFENAPTLTEIEASWFGESAVKKAELTSKQAKMNLR